MCTLEIRKILDFFGKRFFFWGGGVVCFSIGSVPCVPSYTLSFTGVEGVTHGMSFPLLPLVDAGAGACSKPIIWETWVQVPDLDIFPCEQSKYKGTKFNLLKKSACGVKEFVCLSVGRSVSRSVGLSVCRSIGLSVYRSVSPAVPWNQKPVC